ncbi:hypothetical protein HDU98_001165 [Podochytrium sp. JEL0797]|nr:hypothetical protein HDU98_001165 [Podochytrium sp. JEL0797]
MYQSFDFPIFVMPVNPNDGSWAQSIGTLLETAQYNLDRGYQNYPLYSIEFNQFMYGSIDAETCLRRGWCTPVGASSVWGTFSYNMSQKDTKNIVVVSAQLDSNGFFQEFLTNAETTASGYITLLAVANALSQNQPAITSLPSDILFTLFSTEAFGFAGSQRFVQDISTPFKCLQPPANANASTSSCAYQGPYCANPCQPTAGFTQIGFDRISAIVELGQVSGGNGQMYLHVNDVGDAGSQALVKTLSGSATGTGLKVGGSGGGAANVTVQFGPAVMAGQPNIGLPPSSAMSFLQKKNIPAVVIGDFQTSFSNKLSGFRSWPPFYNSIYDDSTQITSESIATMCAVATQTARSVVLLAGGSPTLAPTFSANCTLVSILFDCFTSNSTCPLFRSIYPSQSVPFVSNYPGTFTQQAFTTSPPFLAYNLLANYTAAKRVLNSCDVTQGSFCGNDATSFCVDKTCVTSQTNPHFAYGTGIEMDYATGVFGVVDRRKATWVQSQLSGPPFLPVTAVDCLILNSGNVRIRTFLTTSPLYQGMQVGVGISLTVIVTAATWYAQRYVDAKFK